MEQSSQQRWLGLSWMLRTWEKRCCWKWCTLLHFIILLLTNYQLEVNEVVEYHSVVSRFCRSSVVCTLQSLTSQHLMSMGYRLTISYNTGPLSIPDVIRGSSITSSLVTLGHQIVLFRGFSKCHPPRFSCTRGLVVGVLSSLYKPSTCNRLCCGPWHDYRQHNFAMLNVPLLFLWSLLKECIKKLPCHCLQLKK